jgi:hypothetical protein
MVKGILSLTSIFKFQNKFSRSGIAKHGLLCMQFTDSASKICAGAIIQTNTVPFLLVLSEFFFNFHGYY